MQNGETDMTKLDDIAEAIEALGSTIEEAGSATQSIDQEVDEASATQAAMGGDTMIQGLAQLSSEVEGIHGQLGSVGEAVKSALELARSLAAGT
jgi:chromosome segregation ATPase